MGYAGRGVQETHGSEYYRSMAVQQARSQTDDEADLS